MNNTQTFGLLFVVRHKSKKSVNAGIYMRITVNGRKTEISTKLKCPVSLWDPSKERVIADNKFDYRTVNRMLDHIRTKVQSIYQDLRIKEELITPDIIKNIFCGNKEEGRTLLRLIDYHYNTQKNTLNPFTLRHYNTSAKYLKAFLREVKKANDIYLKQIDYQFICDYDAFLRSYKPLEPGLTALSHNTIMKHLSRFRTLINLAIKLEWMEHYPFKAFRLSYKQTHRKYLMKEEMELIQNKQFTIERLQYTRDLFIFSCYTGLAYSDVMLLRPDNILKGIDGNNWIYTERKKTNTTIRIPLLSVPEQLIEKYRKHPKAMHRGTLFPKMTNQRLNSYLKEVGDMCGITKNLTFHVARHTFATTVTLSNGVPIETVSKILGHTKIVTTQIYSKVLEYKVSQDMDVLRTKLESNNGQEQIGASG